MSSAASSSRRSWRRAVRTSVSTSRARIRAISRPMPAEAPVTSAVLPLKSSIISSLDPGGGRASSRPWPASSSRLRPGERDEGFELAEAGFELGVLAAERLELVPQAVALALAGAAEVARAPRGCGGARGRRARDRAGAGAAPRDLRIAELGERAHDVDAQVGIGVVEQVLERLARLAVGRRAWGAR